jgi:anti-anti-sigma factor
MDATNELDAAVEGILVDPDGTEYSIPPRGLMIGRRSPADVALKDPEVSRRHARVLSRGGLFIVVDLGSTNGTILNEQRVSQEEVLSDGDVLRIGDTSLTFRLRRLQRSAHPEPGSGEGPTHAEEGGAVNRRPGSQPNDPAGTASATASRLSIVTTDQRAGENGAVACLALGGVLDVETASVFHEHTSRLLETGVAHFTLDLRNLQYLDSAGLGALVKLLRGVKPLGGSIQLRHLQPPVREVLDLTHLDRVFSIE